MPKHKRRTLEEKQAWLRARMEQQRLEEARVATEAAARAAAEAAAEAAAKVPAAEPPLGGRYPGVTTREDDVRLNFPYVLFMPADVMDSVEDHTGQMPSLDVAEKWLQSHSHAIFKMLDKHFVDYLHKHWGKLGKTTCWWD